MVKIALVGAGGMGSMHAGCYADIPNATLVGVYDTRLSAAEELAGKHGARAYADFDAMLSESGADVVDVCCPTPWHEEYVCQAAARAAEVGLRGIAVENGCKGFHLDSGVQRKRAHQFYLREGLELSSYHFSVRLNGR